MDSGSLAANGFRTWRLFNSVNSKELLEATPTKPGVYVIRARTPFRRRSGTSDILYVGSAANQSGLRMRLGHYFSPGPTQWTNQRLLARCGDSNDFEISWVVVSSGEEAKALEASILQQYVGEHHELTPENRVLPDSVAITDHTQKTDAKPLPSAQLMFDAVREAPMSPRTRRALEHFRDTGDCTGMMTFLRRCVAQRPDVGSSIMKAGKVSFESRIQVVEEIYATALVDD